MDILNAVWSRDRIDLLLEINYWFVIEIEHLELSVCVIYLAKAKMWTRATLMGHSLSSP